jgi:hypothetical protein
MVGKLALVAVHGAKVSICSRMQGFIDERPRSAPMTAKRPRSPTRCELPALGRRESATVIPDEERAKSVLSFVSDYSKVATGGLLDVNGGEYMTP